MTEDELIELMAAAHRRAWAKSREEPMHGALAALREAGFAIVPVEPTEAMIEAGATVSNAEYGDDCKDSIDKPVTRAAWSAMLAASPFATDKGMG